MSDELAAHDDYETIYTDMLCYVDKKQKQTCQPQSLMMHLLDLLDCPSSLEPDCTTTHLG